MKLIFCLAKDKSMMFFGKRQSKDEVLRAWLLERIGDAKLWMSNYSAKQFEGAAGIVVDDNYMANASADDWCFVEDKDFSSEGVSEILLCHWNRSYPGDKFFDLDLKALGFKKTDSIDIVGKSHDKITVETYVRG